MPNITGLEAPAVGADRNTYPTKISNSFSVIDAHDHTSGKGVQIPAGGIGANAITSDKLHSSVVDDSTLEFNSGVLRAKDAGLPSIKRVTTYATKSAAYTLTASDGVILGSASGASFTLSLPAASTVPGREFCVIRTDQTLANAITIDPNSSETIGGASTFKLMTQYERVTFFSDGTNWQIREHSCPSVWTSYSATLSAGFGGTATSTMYWRRSGDSIQILGRITCGTVAASVGTVTLPSGLTISTKVIGITQVAPYAEEDNGAPMGTVLANGSGGGVGNAALSIGRQSTTETGLFSANVSDILANTNVISFLTGPIPITNWEG